jgi:hypothetical protein
MENTVMTRQPQHRESMIALKAARKAIGIARDVGYPPVDLGPPIYSSQWIREREEEQRREKPPPATIRLVAAALRDDEVAPEWLRIFLVGCILLVALLALYAIRSF